jgi:hypothetical protein
VGKIDPDKIDPFVKGVLKTYLDKDQLLDSIWPLEKGGRVIAYIAKHKYLELIATKANVEWEPPIIVEGDGLNKNVSMVVTGSMGSRKEWSIGEASIHNYKTSGKMDSYPYAMAEKRGKDRVILKLVGLHGFVYSSEEADFDKGESGSDNFHEDAWKDYCKGAKEFLEQYSPEKDDEQDVVAYWESQEKHIERLRRSYPKFAERLDGIYEETIKKWN